MYIILVQRLDSLYSAQQVIEQDCCAPGTNKANELMFVSSTESGWHADRWPDLNLFLCTYISDLLAENS